MEGFILIVDDNPFYGKLIVYILSHQTPYQIQLVETGFHALNAAKKITPLLFLLDYQLPDMTGIELYDQLHKREGREMVPAIMVSANLPDQKLEKRLLARRMTGMSKPFDTRKLLLAIDLVIAKQSETRS